MRKPLYSWLLSLLLVGLAALSACGDDGGDMGVDADVPGVDAAFDPTLPVVDCVNVPNYSEMTVHIYCTGCHSSDNVGGARRGAPVGVDYDNYEVAMVNAVPGTRRIFAGTMPPGGNEHIPQDQKDEFYNWSLCGTPQ